MEKDSYLSGFGSYFQTEAEPGALPEGQNSPKFHKQGLYPEQINGSAFTMKRVENLKAWFYRIRPSVVHHSFTPYKQDTWFSTARNSEPTSPQQHRWQPLEPPKQDTDFVDGVYNMVATAGPGCAVHHYIFNKAMGNKFFYDSDGELMIVPESGELQILTEMGTIELEPHEIALIPRGIKFQINPAKDGTWCRGYVGENSGGPFTLPDLGPLGANALAAARDFLYPKAKYYDEQGDFTLVTKFGDNFFQAEMENHPLDVVAWHGNYAPYKYDLRKFNTMGTVSYDHPDPSIYTVLTSPSTVPGMANCDFVIFPPRWLVGENTFRPPYYHRNFMNEYMGLIHGVYDAKVGGGFVPGGSSLHNCMAAHGPDADTFNKAIDNAEAPQKIDNTMAFMFETCQVFHPSDFALKTSSLEKDYWQCWQGLKSHFNKDA